MILDDVRSLLKAAGIDWRIFDTQIPAGSPPAVPDDVIALYEYPGSPPLHVKGTKAPARRQPRFQVVCRSKSAATARAKAEQVFGILPGTSGELSVRALGEPSFLDYDAERRVRIACNYEATRT